MQAAFCPRRPGRKRPGTAPWGPADIAQPDREAALHQYRLSLSTQNPWACLGSAIGPAQRVDRRLAHRSNGPEQGEARPGDGFLPVVLGRTGRSIPPKGRIMGMRPGLAIVLPTWGVVLLAGCARPAGPAFDEEQLRAHDLRVYWQATLPLEKGESLVACRLLEENVYCLTNQATVFAVHADAGVVSWSRRLGGRGNLVFEPTVSFGSGLDEAVVLTSQVGVWVVQRNTGKLIAEVYLPYAPGGAAVASEELIWCGSVQGVMHATLFGAGYDHWRVQTGGGILATPILLPDRVVFCSSDGNVYCATPITKELLWTFDTDGAITASPGHNDDMVFIPSHDRHLYCLDLDTGELIWQSGSPEPLARRPQVTDDTVYLPIGQSGLAALDLATGSQRWKLENGRDFVAQHRDTAHVVDITGDLVAVNNQSGEEKWRIFPRELDLVAANEKDSAMYLASYGGRVTCLRRVDVPYLRRGDIEAVMRSGRRSGEEAGAQGPGSADRSASARPGD